MDKCPKCGSEMWHTILLMYPERHRYRCKCGYTEDRDEPYC